MDPGAVLLALLGSANLASRHEVFEQYDSTVGADTVAGPGRGRRGPARQGHDQGARRLDGRQPGRRAHRIRGSARRSSVAEATRNVSITGARPLGVTNCLNYGDPTRPEAFWQLTEGVRGLGDACRALGLPVTGGNVSLYNESPTGSIAPTPEIGVVGLLDDVATLVGPAFAHGARHDPARRRGDAGPGRLRVRGARRAPPRTTRPRSTSPRGRAPGVHPRGDRARPRRLGAGRLGRRARGRPRGGRDVGRPRRRHPGRGRALAGRRAVRREPVAARRDLPAAVRAGARAPGPPARPAGRGARVRRRRPAGHRAGRGRRHRRRRGTRQPDRRCARGPVADLRHAWEHGLARALGWEG